MLTRWNADGSICLSRRGRRGDQLKPDAGINQMSVKFNLHNVVNTETKASARVRYSLDNRTDQRKCVTIYGKDVLEELNPVFGEIVMNDSDSMTDYYQSDRVNLFEDHPLYVEARAAAERKRAADEDRYNRKNQNAASPVPAYNRYTDGNYSGWLAANNID